MNFKIFVFLFCLIIISCKKENRKTPPKFKNKKENIEINETKKDSLTFLFSTSNKENTEEIRISTYNSVPNDKYFLSGDKNFILVSKYLKKGNQFELIRKDTLISNEFTYTEIGKESLKKINIDNKEYIYLSVRQSYQGTAITEKSAFFIILNINSLENFTLVYSGENSFRSKEAIDGEFGEDKRLDQNPEIKKALYNFAEKSKWVFHSSPDKNDYSNYVQKWETDNNTYNHMANGNSGIPHIVYSTYYKEDLFKFTGDISDQKTIENDNFKIVCYFRGNILAFDKNKKLYFPVYTESCVTGCHKEISFKSENIIEVKYTESSEDETTIINLNEIKFKN